MSIKIELTNSTSTIDITQFIEGVTWSGSYKDCARKLEISFISSMYDKNIPIFDIQAGHLIRFFENDIEVFRGYIVTKGKSSSGNAVKIVCMDQGIYTNKNEGFYNFKDETPEGATKKICEDFGITTNSIATTNIKFSKKFFGKKLYEIIMSAYTIASLENDKKYMCYFKNGMFNVVEKGTVLNLKFENGFNIIESTFEESILDMVNKVIVLDDTGKEVSKSENTDDMKAYGTFQKILKSEEGKDNELLAKKELKGIKQTASLSGFGDTTCIAGFGVKITDSYTGLTGLFYIASDTHTWKNGMYSIKLTLEFENLMNEVNVGEEDKPPEEGGGGSGATGTAKDVIDECKKHLGKQYVWGATGPNTFDCSGLMVYCFKTVGINLPRVTYDQIKQGSLVGKADLQPGDLVFFATDGTGRASHVGLYVGDNQFIHAPNSKSVVKYDNLNSGYYSNTFMQGRRVI